MNAIDAYLDSMFSTLPQTPRLLEAKTELRGMMEDAYTGLIADGSTENEAVGEVIRDFGNLDELAPVLGIATDIAPAPAPADGGANAAASYPPVTLDEARSYADAHERTRYRVSTSVVLFVLSPAALIFLSVAAQHAALPITAEGGVFAGLVVLLVLVAAGVLLFISAARTQASPRRIAEGRFTTNPAVTRWADALADRHEAERIRGLQIAMLLSILAPIPLIGFALFLGNSPQRGLWVIVGVIFVLVVVAIALGILLPRTWAHTAADRLTHGALGRRRATGGR